MRVRGNVGDVSVRSSLPFAGVAQPAPFGCGCYDTSSSQGYHSKFRQRTKPRTVDLSNGEMSLCVLVFLTGLLLSLSVSRLLASPSRRESASRKCYALATKLGYGFGRATKRTPSTELSSPAFLHFAIDASLLSHTNLGICFLSLSLCVSSGSVSRLLRRILTLLESQRASVQEAQNVPALGVVGSQSGFVEEHKRLVGHGYGCAVSNLVALAASATFLHLVMIIRQSNLNEHRVAPVWMSNVLSTRRDLHQGQDSASQMRQRCSEKKRWKLEGERGN